MSSNVGLTTPRGSGTSGYVQRNLSSLRPSSRTAPYPPPTSANAYNPPAARKPDRSILAHEAKRTVEIKCLKLRDELEDAGELDEDEIDEQVDALRKKLMDDLLDNGLQEQKGAAKLKAHQVHEIAQAKMMENERMERALKIAPDYEEGGHWKKQEKRKMEREMGLQSRPRDAPNRRDD